MIEKSFFILSIIGVSYSYFIYPLILKLIPRQKFEPRDSSAHDAPILPKLSFIITAFNEEKLIKSKLENTLQVKYPRELLEIIVASDGSTDKTNEIVKDFKSHGVELVEVTDRKGKENAQRQAIEYANGEIIVFSDVSTSIQEDALQVIADSFENPKVGAVSSEDRFVTEDGKIAGEGAYVKYEMWLRNLEGSRNSLIGLSGSFFAARREVCMNWDISVPSDFNTAISCIREGFIAISSPSLLGFYPNLKDETKEYQRKVRTVIRGIAALFKSKEVLNPFKYGLFSFQMLSHKLMRWSVPWFLITALVTNLLILQDHLLFQFSMLSQVAFYLLALVGWLSSSARQNTLFKIPYFFIQVNLAIAHATLRYLSGERVTVWTPSKR